MARRTSDSSSRSSRTGSTTRAGTRGSSSSSSTSTSSARGATRSAGAAKRGATTKRAATRPAGTAKRPTAKKAAPAKRSTTKRVGTGISRVDQESTRTHGYAVRIGYERTSTGGWRPRHTKFFGDASHGSSAKALRAAQEFARDAQEQDAKPSRARGR